MAELGALVLWAAAPTAALAAGASLAGALTGRRELARLGGRASYAAAGLLLISLIGLGQALIAVDLRFAYVATHSSFRLAPGWRLAALWSGPAGAALTVTFLLAAVTGLSHRLGGTRQAAARTGALGLLALAGLLLVLSAARPFVESGAPAVAGISLPAPLRDPVWQLQLWAGLLAVPATALVFAGIVGEQLVEDPGSGRPERTGTTLTALVLTIAVLAGLWRAYGSTGELLGVRGEAEVLVFSAPWLVALAGLHAPAGPVAPGWALRWRRITGVALFPAAVGSLAACVAGVGGAPPAVPWVAGLAVGVVSGAMSGVGGSFGGAVRAERISGLGLSAFVGGLVTLVAAGLVASRATLQRPASSIGLMLALLVPLAVLGAAPFVRTRTRTGVRLSVAAVTVGTGALAYLLGAPIGFTLAAAFTATAVLGAGLDAGRVGAVLRRPAVFGNAGSTAAFHARTGRRSAAVLAHLGIACGLLGLTGDRLAVTDTRFMVPGERMEATTAGVSVQLTYLGLSRYQIGELDRTVASFAFRREDGRSRMVTAEMTYDLASRRVRKESGLVRGLLRDYSVALVGRGDGEEVRSRLSVRPLASLVWIGGGLLVLALGVSAATIRLQPLPEAGGGPT